MGEKKAEVGKPTVLFERRGRDIMRIHEWTDTECKIFEKIGKNSKKKLIESKPKRQVPSDSNLSDYIMSSKK